MALHYTLTNFVRQASNARLAEYFEVRGIYLGIDVRSLKPRTYEPLLDAVNRLTDEQRAGLDRDFMEVTALADKAGLQHIINEARFRGVDIGPGLQEQNSFFNKAFWTYLNLKAVFDGAASFAAPYTQGRYWKRRLPLPAVPGADLKVKAKALEAALSSYFLKEEGRGKACQVEYLTRPPLHWFHAYPEDFQAAPQA